MAEKLSKKEIAKKVIKKLKSPKDPTKKSFIQNRPLIQNLKNQNKNLKLMNKNLLNKKKIKLKH